MIKNNNITNNNNNSNTNNSTSGVKYRIKCTHEISAHTKNI